MCSAQQQTPAAITQNDKPTVYTSSKPEVANGLKFAGTEYSYKVVDKDGKTVNDVLVQEVLTPIPGKTTQLPHPSTWNAKDGTFVDAIGYGVPTKGSFPKNCSNQFEQQFKTASDAGLTILPQKNLITITSDAKRNITGTATPEQ